MRIEEEEDITIMVLLSQVLMPIKVRVTEIEIEIEIVTVDHLLLCHLQATTDLHLPVSMDLLLLVLTAVHHLLLPIPSMVHRLLGHMVTILLHLDRSHLPLKAMEDLLPRINTVTIIDPLFLRVLLKMILTINKAHHLLKLLLNKTQVMESNKQRRCKNS